MKIKVTIKVDDDNWAKHAYGVKFDDDECQARFGTSNLNGRVDCERVIENARNAGYDIDPNYSEYHY